MDFQEIDDIFPENNRERFYLSLAHNMKISEDFDNRPKIILSDQTTIYVFLPPKHEKLTKNQDLSSKKSRTINLKMWIHNHESINVDGIEEHIIKKAQEIFKINQPRRKLDLLPENVDFYELYNQNSIRMKEFKVQKDSEAGKRVAIKGVFVTSDTQQKSRIFAFLMGQFSI